MQRATALPRNTKINYHDHSLSVQARLFKSIKLWSYYVDLEEAIGTVESTKAVYDKILDLRIANAQIIVNYAAFLEENKYYEESFKVYERGVELFTFPVSFEIWNIYLAKFVKRYVGILSPRLSVLILTVIYRAAPNSKEQGTCSSRHSRNALRRTANPSSSCTPSSRRSMVLPSVPWRSTTGQHKSSRIPTSSM